MKFWSRAVMAAAVAFAMSALVADAAPSPTPSPAKPTRITAYSAKAGDQQAQLSWSPPTTGKPINTYTVTASPGGYTSTDPSTTRTVPNLTNGTQYTIKVFATNDAGNGPTSTALVTPRAVPPGAPGNLAAIQGPGAGQYTLSWTPPTATGSSPDGVPPTIDHYTVTVNPGGITQRNTAAQTTYVASNLADNVTYAFSVSATNSRNVTGSAATVYAPLPSAATIGLDPSAGGPTTSITATGQNFLKNESLTLYWDTSAHGIAAVITDDNGAFTKVVTPFAGDKPAVHKLCASVQPKPCASFTLRGAPTPTPTPPASPTDTSPSSSPTDTSPASGVRPAGGGISGLDIITRPPFVFLPIIGILGLLGVLAYWFMSGRGRRRPMAPTSAATVTHMASRPDYIAPFPPTPQPSAWPPAGGPSIPTPQHPAGQAAWEQPVQGSPQPQFAPPPPPAAPPPAPPQLPVAPPPPTASPAVAPPPVQWPQPPAPPSAPVQPSGPPTWPSAPDEPPDLPEPSD